MHGVENASIPDAILKERLAAVLKKLVGPKFGSRKSMQSKKRKSFGIRGYPRKQDGL